MRDGKHFRFGLIGEESFFEFFLLFEPFFATGDSLIKLDHLIGDNLAFLQGFTFGDEFVKSHAGAVERLLDFPPGPNRFLDVLTDGLGDLVLVLLCHFDEGVEFAKVDSGLYRILDCTNPSFELFLLGALEPLEVVGNAAGHLSVAQGKRLVAAVLVVVQVVGEQDEELGLDVIISHLMEKLHSLCSSSVS